MFMKNFLLLICYIHFTGLLLSQNSIVVKGSVLDKETQLPIANVNIEAISSSSASQTNIKGNYSLVIQKKERYTISFKQLGYDNLIKIVDTKVTDDTITLNVYLQRKSYILDSVSIIASLKPDTLLGSPKFSIYDFDFYEDKYILLTANKSLANAELKLSDNTSKVITTYAVPKEAGIAKEFYHDYMGYTNLICDNYIYRVNLYHNRFVLLQLSVKEVNTYLKPIIDTINHQLIFTDYWKDYPQFNYYSYNEKDSIKQKIITIEDKELMDSYNFEYWNLTGREKLEARRLAESYKTDKKIISALMTGFTKSMMYTPLYAPLFVINDTICVFDHYKNQLYHLNNEGLKIDSTVINYNHPKNWREWKNTMLKDDIEKTIFAVYDKNGHKYLKQINHNSGQIMGKYKLQFHSASKLKIHNGYAYYIYRPFESTQEKFFYRELIKPEIDN